MDKYMIHVTTLLFVLVVRIDSSSVTFRRPVVEYAINKVPRAPGVFLDRSIFGEGKGPIEDIKLLKPDNFKEESYMKNLTEQKNVEQLYYNRFNMNHPVFSKMRKSGLRTNGRNHSSFRAKLRKRFGLPTKAGMRQTLSGNMGKSSNFGKEIPSALKQVQAPLIPIKHNDRIKTLSQSEKEFRKKIHKFLNRNIQIGDVDRTSVNRISEKLMNPHGSQDDFIHNLTSGHFKNTDWLSENIKHNNIMLKSALMGISKDLENKIVIRRNETIAFARDRIQINERPSYPSDKEMLTSVINIISNGITDGEMTKETSLESNENISNHNTSQNATLLDFKPSLLLSVSKKVENHETTTSKNHRYEEYTFTIEDELNTTEFPTVSWEPEPDTSRYRPGTFSDIDIYGINNDRQFHSSATETKAITSRKRNQNVKPPQNTMIILPPRNMAHELKEKADVYPLIAEETHDINGKTKQKIIPNWVLSNIKRNHLSKPKRNRFADSGGLIAITGLAIIGSFFSYLFLAYGGLVVGREEPDPMLSVIQGTRKGLNTLLNGLDEFDNFIGLRSDTKPNVNARNFNNSTNDITNLDLYKQLVKNQHRQLKKIFSIFMHNITNIITVEPIKHGPEGNEYYISAGHNSTKENWIENNSAFKYTMKPKTQILNSNQSNNKPDEIGYYLNTGHNSTSESTTKTPTDSRESTIAYYTNTEFTGKTTAENLKSTTTNNPKSITSTVANNKSLNSSASSYLQKYYSMIVKNMSNSK